MGPDMYTLRGWIEIEVGLDSGGRLDAAHALLSDAVTAAFGARWYAWLTQALTAEGRNPEDLSVVLSDDRLAARVLERMRARMGEDDEAPAPPDDEEFGWSAYPPGDPAGSRQRYRRAVRERKEKARRRLVFPPRPRVAGPRNR